MKVYIEVDEWYPVYSPVGKDWGIGDEVDVPEEKLDEWHRVFDAFWRTQKELRLLKEGGDQ